MDNFSKQIYEAGINDGRAEGISEATIRFIKNTMLSDSCSVDQAMVKLHIPPEEHQYFKDLLAKEQETPVQKAPAIWQALFLLHDIRVYICSSYSFLQTILFTTPV